MADAQVHLGDCLDIMPAMATGSVDLVYADLPYATTANAFDVLIPFAPLWAEYKRLLTPQGVVVLHGSQPFTTDLILSNRAWFKYCLVWEKDNGSNFLNARHQPLKVHEDIAIFSPAPASHSPNPTMTYNPQMVVGKPYKASRNKTGLHTFHTSPAGHQRENNGSRYPRSVLKYKMESGLHPTQKPTLLAEWIVRTYSPKGGTVLDNCCGSCASGVAAINCGRHYIGIERDAVYHATAQARISEAQQRASSPA